METAMLALINIVIYLCTLYFVQARFVRHLAVITTVVFCSEGSDVLFTLTLHADGLSGPKHIICRCSYGIVHENKENLPH